MGAEVLAVLEYVLPGLLAAWVFHAFTSYPKPEQWEPPVQALIFTLLVQGLSTTLRLIVECKLGVAATKSWSDGVSTTINAVLALLLGFVFAYFANTDKFHALVRKARISKETSYPSEWFGEFSQNITYVVLHLIDGRRVYGWPKEWPSNRQTGHFTIQ
ncbi:MAG: hypothetical protein GKR94_25645 [Gammaproteobacteria bacterium]|nr:hypothetical protein [Gammaproteobacteria bacterium]